MTPVSPASRDRLSALERVSLALLFVGFVAFGGMVELRSAFLKNRKTDFGVYTRTAWAVWAGEDIYSIADDNGWHYCYPPPFAVLMTPLADPPAGVDRDWYPPFWLSVAIWYIFSVGCLIYTVDRFASAVLSNEPRGSRRWWYARTIPINICLGGVGYTLGRGQVNILAVAMLAGMFAAVMQNRRIRAGLWLGAAICLKVIPAFLGLYLLIRRDVKSILGVVLACVIGLGVIPAAVWGVNGAIDLNVRMVKSVLAPGASGSSGDQTRAKELTNDTATDSQSFRSAMHTWRYPDPETRPSVADQTTSLSHWAISGVLTLATLAARLWKARQNPGSSSEAAANELILFGALTTLMLLVTPVSHMHYYAYAMPMVCGLWLRGLVRRPDSVLADGWTLAVLSIWGVATFLPLFPWDWAVFLRQRGFGSVVTVGLWAFAIVQYSRPAAAAAAAEPMPVRRAA